MARITESAIANKTKTQIAPIKWSAPETLMAAAYSTKADVWSFGVVLIEMLISEERKKKKINKKIIFFAFFFFFHIPISTNFFSVSWNGTNGCWHRGLF